MAERRMFTKKVTDDDHFMELSASAQALYLHLTMSADDDGFCNQLNVCMFKAHASVQDLEALLDKRYLIQFENGVIVIKHWRMANALRKDRYTPTAFQEELSKLGIKDNGSYTLFGNHLATIWQPDGNQLAPQDRLGKDSIGEYRIEEDREGEEIVTVSNETVCCTRGAVQRVVEAWNSLGLKKITKIVPDTQRGQWLKKRIQDYGVEEVLRAIENVRSSKFLNGDNKNGWEITFDWFIRPNNFVKVLDGNYDDRMKDTLREMSVAEQEMQRKYDMIREWASE